MAEHNLFLGTARKSVGDVTLMRRAGRQLARVRLRTISNPKTEAQAIQRNFVAPVARFYAPLRKVLERSFEGLNKDESYNKFQKVNIDLARKGQWFLPKGASWQPLPYLLSQGSLPSLNEEFGEWDVGFGVAVYSTASITTVNTIGQLSQAFKAMGLQNGDVVTGIAAIQDSELKIWSEVSQFIINPNDARPITSIQTQNIGWTFNNGTIAFESYENSAIAAAIIYARKSKFGWLRNTQKLLCDSDYMATVTSLEAREASIASYQAPNSDEGGGVYPGGDDNLFNVAAVDGRALLFIGGQFSAQGDGAAGNPRIMLKPDNIDRYYYIKLGESRYLATNSAGSLTPSDWRGVAGVPAPADNSNTIDAPAGSTMRDYLASIGWVDS